VADLDRALSAVPAQLARGFATICVKPSQFIDDTAAGKGGGVASPLSVLIAAVGVFAIGAIVSRYAKEVHAAGSLYVALAGVAGAEPLLEPGEGALAPV
jgi:hypothetical protein